MEKDKRVQVCRYVRLSDVEGLAGGLLIDERDFLAVELNMTAFLILSLCEERESLREVVSVFAMHSQCEEKEAERIIVDFLRDFESRGWVSVSTLPRG